MASFLNNLITVTVVVSQLASYCTCFKVYLAARQHDFDNGNKTLSLTCYFDEQESGMVVFLLRNETILTSYNRIIDRQLQNRLDVQFSSGVDNFELKVNATHADNGLYECCNFRTVKGANKELTDNRLDSCSGEYIDTQHQYPSEMQPLCLPAEVVQAKIDDQVTLSCVSQYPNASIQWTNANSIESTATSSEVVFRTRDSAISKLTLNVSYTDINDVYTCAISDLKGNLLYGKCSMYVNIIWPSLTLTTYEMEEQVAVVCNLTFPLDSPIIWTWDLNPNINSSHISMSNNTITISTGPYGGRFWSAVSQLNSNGERVYDPDTELHVCCNGLLYDEVTHKMKCCTNLDLVQYETGTEPNLPVTKQVQFETPTIPNSTDTTSMTPGRLHLTEKAAKEDPRSSSRWILVFCLLFMFLILIMIVMDKRWSIKYHRTFYPTGMKIRHRTIQKDKKAPAKRIKPSSISAIFKVCSS